MKTVVDTTVDPVVAEKDAVRRQAMKMFAKSDFAALEKTAADFRTNKLRFSDGLWKLKEFYEGLRARNEIGEEKDWAPWFAKVDRWREAYPDSNTLPVVAARGWLDFADDKQDQKAREEATKTARGILETANPSTRCVHWYLVMEDIATRQDWLQAEFSRLLDEAAAAEPSYYDYYAAAAEYFLPRTGKGGLDRLAQEAATKFDPGEGRAAYARTVWFMDNSWDDIFGGTGVTWPKLRDGFLDIQKRYPDSRWNANAFCRFAVQAKDRQMASALFNRIGDYGDPNWGGYARYEMARLWADPATPASHIEPLLSLRDSSHSTIHSIAYSPDGALIASGTQNGRITVWDAASGKELWSERVAPFPVMSVAFSPTGELLAAGAGQDYRATEPGLAKVWNVATKEEVASAQPAGVVWNVAFAPDGQTLALSGGKWENQAELSLLDIATRQLRPLPWTANHDHVLKGVAISPDGKTLVTDCYQSITVWSLQEGRVVFDRKNVVKDFVLSVKFSRDGKTLVTCGAPMRGHNDNEPGELTLWDTATWMPRTPRAQTDAGGLVGLAVSPDGKWIAGGG